MFQGTILGFTWKGWVNPRTLWVVSLYLVTWPRF